MRIVWNKNEERFEAQFTPGEQWNADKAAAQDAGFKTDGPPAWVWFVSKSTPLAKLRENRPASGLTITKDALAAYDRLHAVEQKNAELKAWAHEQEKRVKKEREQTKIDEQKGDEEFDEEYEARRYREIPEYWKGKSELTRDDMPADILARFTQREPIPQRRGEPTGTCMICGDPIYSFEKQDPAMCIWDEGPGEEKFMKELIA